MIVQPLTRSTPQITQLELLIPAPLLKDSQVETKTDLVDLNVAYNYLHKLVWVMDEACYYYLMEGNGAQQWNWKKMAYTASIKVWQSDIPYLEGDVVYANGKLWSAIRDVPMNIPPPNDTYWLCIAGENATMRFAFTNANNIEFYTDIKNPMIHVEIGSGWQLQNGSPVIDPNTGFAVLLNSKIAHPHLIYLNEEPITVHGMKYKVVFYENEATTNTYTGWIIVK
jgi:hypothetical protein